MSSAIPFNLDQSKVLSSGNGLNVSLGVHILHRVKYRKKNAILNVVETVQRLVIRINILFPASFSSHTRDSYHLLNHI